MAKTVVIMMTAYEILERAIEAMKLGAYDIFSNLSNLMSFETRFVGRWKL